jgi:transposase
VDSQNRRRNVRAVGDREFDPDWPAARIVAMYSDGLSTYEIQRRTGIGRQRVTRLLRREGITVAPRGRGRHKRTINPEIAARIMHLYVAQRLDSDAVGVIVGLSGRTVRNLLTELGIRRRSRGGHNRDDRVVVAPEHVQAMYVNRGMTADQVAAKLEVHRNAVLRSAHDHNFPVRPGGAPTKNDLDIRTLEEIYRDRFVSAALDRHRVVRAVLPGSISDRFPEPVAITEELVEELYERCGLSVRHIELVTGVPQATILRRMRVWKIDRRKPGGLSPYLASWRNQQRGKR